MVSGAICQITMQDYYAGPKQSQCKINAKTLQDQCKVNARSMTEASDHYHT